MIKIIEMKSVQKAENVNKAFVILYADTKTEVTADATIVGMPSNTTIDPGSMVYTANLDIGIYNSNGNWTWATGNTEEE